MLPAMMQLDRAYQLDEEDALARLRALSDYWTKRHGIVARWSGNEVALSGKVKGVKFEGQVRIGGGRLVGEMDAGFLAEKLGARKYVEGKLDDYLDPKTTLDELRARIPK
jgi:hypothetical protein